MCAYYRQEPLAVLFESAVYVSGPELELELTTLEVRSSIGLAMDCTPISVAHDLRIVFTDIYYSHVIPTTVFSRNNIHRNAIFKGSFFK